MSKRPAAQTPWLSWVIFFVIVIVAHEWLKRAMLDLQVVASLISPGSHVRNADAALAIGFMLLRMLVVFCRPGPVLSRIGLLVYERFRRTAGRYR